MERNHDRYPSEQTRHECAAGHLLAIAAMALEHHRRFSGAFVTDRAAGAAAGERDGKLFTAGSFLVAGGIPATGIAVWHIPHSLNINQAGNQLSLRRPATGTNFVLEAKASLGGTNWSEVSSPPALHSNECVVTDTIAGPQKVYRLRRK